MRPDATTARAPGSRRPRWAIASLVVVLSACASAGGPATDAGRPGQTRPTYPATATASGTTPAAATRDPKLWPFAATSIWNRPIGSGAQYRPARIEASQQTGTFAEEEVIVLEPTAPLVDVVESDADWDAGRDRCIPEADRKVVDRLPIPAGFVTEPKIGGTPNNAAAILRPDGHTLAQSQPLVRCADGTATSHYRFADTDLYGDGIVGAHGGSALSALGGTIRLGELTPGATIRHSLKIVLDGRFLHYDAADPTPGYRWPASKADGQASRSNYSGTEPALEMGSLLALPPDFDLATLRNEPARIIARAARDYGIYVVDTSGWDADYLAVEWSPQGRVLDEFQQVWGMPFVQGDRSDPWALDLATIETHLAVVSNNGPDTPGGGGRPRAPDAPPFTPN